MIDHTNTFNDTKFIPPDNKAVTNEFINHSENLHQACVKTMMKIRRPFLLLCLIRRISLLRRISGSKHDMHNFGWAHVPKAWDFLFEYEHFEYEERTTARELLLPLMDGEQLCGACWSKWWQNIDRLWSQTVIGLQREIRRGYPGKGAPKEYDSFHHIVNCLLKEDP